MEGGEDDEDEDQREGRWWNGREPLSTSLQVQARNGRRLSGTCDFSAGEGVTPPRLSR